MGWQAEIVRENTEWAELHINMNVELYDKMKKAKDGAKNSLDARRKIKQIAIEYAESHNYEFGNVFISQLDDVSWDTIRKNLQ